MDATLAALQALYRDRRCFTKRRPPSSAMRLSVTVLEGTTISVSWGPPRTDRVSVRWYPMGQLGGVVVRL